MIVQMRLNGGDEICIQLKIISTPENPDYGSKVWSSTLSKWIAGASNGVKIAYMMII